MSIWRFQLYDLVSGVNEGDVPYRDIGRALQRLQWLNFRDTENRFSLRPVRSDDWIEELHGDGIPSIEDYDMLIPIKAYPIKVPIYRNEFINSFTDWYKINEPALVEYYSALRVYVPEGVEPLLDFFEFAATAHEREQGKVSAATLAHGDSL
jgi:hypothetical protein